MTNSKWAVWAVVGMALLLAGGLCGVEENRQQEPDDDLHPGYTQPDDTQPGGHPNSKPLITVYVVDLPAQVDEFVDLGEAIEHLCTRLPDGESGEVVIRTERALLVESLTFGCAVSIRADSNLSPLIIGPGFAPLVVNASAALGLSGLTIINGSGVLVNTSGGNLDLQHNDLPNGLTVDIGALPSARNLRHAKDAGTVNWKIVANNLGEGLKLNLGSNLGASSKCTVSNNQGHTCTLSGSGSIAGELTYRENVFGILDVDTSLRASARLDISGHRSLDSLAIRLQNSDAPEIKLSNNVTASARLSLLGQASAKLTLSQDEIGDGEVKFGVSDLEIKALGVTYGRLAMLATTAVALPVLRYTETDSKILGTFSFTALEAGTENARASIEFRNVDAQGNFEMHVKCQTRLSLSQATAIRGAASIKVDGNLWELEEAGVRWDAGVVFETTGFNAGIKVASKAGTYKDRFNVFAQPSATLTIELTDAIFQGAAIGIGKRDKPQATQKAIRTAQAAGDSVTLSNLQWTEHAMALGIMDIDGPVTIENCRIGTSLQAISFAQIKGPITVRGNTFETRLAFYDCDQGVTVENNTFAASGLAGADVWLWEARGLVQNNVMPNGLIVAGQRGYGRVTDNQISGNISVGNGGRLRLEGNDLTGARVSDDFIMGAGLVNNPVWANSGLDPDDVSSPVDFNSNGCADYPTPYDERDGDGKCGYDGVAVPHDPGL